MCFKCVCVILGVFGIKVYVCFEVKGVCLIIVFWNYLVNFLFGLLVLVIVVGNSVIIKLFEMMLNVFWVIIDIVEEVFMLDLVKVIEGDVLVFQEFLLLLFDYIFFVGSLVIGKVVMEVVVKNLILVMLEFGGKLFIIVGFNVNIKKVVCNIVWGKFVNNGQICIVLDYVYVYCDIVVVFKDLIWVEIG